MEERKKKDEKKKEWKFDLDKKINQRNHWTVMENKCRS